MQIILLKKIKKTKKKKRNNFFSLNFFKKVFLLRKIISAFKRCENKVLNIRTSFKIKNAIKKPKKIKINKFIIKRNGFDRVCDFNIGILDLYFNVFLKSSALKYIDYILKKKLNYKDAFKKVTRGIEHEYGYRIEIVSDNYVQTKTKDKGNFASVDFSKKVILMEKSLFAKDYLDALNEIKHEFGYILLKDHYSKDIPLIGSTYATHHLDRINSIFYEDIIYK